jgi:hypothetical protein
MACEMFRKTWGIPENDPESPLLEGAEKNQVFEDHRHKSLVEEADEEVVEFVMEAIED